MWRREFWSWVMVKWRRRIPKAIIRRRLAHVLYQLWTESPRICLDSIADRCAVTTDVQQRYIFQAYRYSPWYRPSKPQCTYGCHQHIGDAARRMSQSHMTVGPRIDWSTEVRGLTPGGTVLYCIVLYILASASRLLVSARSQNSRPRPRPNIFWLGLDLVISSCCYKYHKYLNTNRAPNTSRGSDQIVSLLIEAKPWTEARSQIQDRFPVRCGLRLILEDTFEGRPIYVWDKPHRKTGNWTF